MKRLRHDTSTDTADVPSSVDDPVPDRGEGPDDVQGDVAEDEVGVRAPGLPATEEERMIGADRDVQVSVISEGTKIEGSVRAAGPLRVEGQVVGEIHAQGEVSLTPHGRVDANIKATSITLAGVVKGDLEATGDVSLPAESRVLGNIRARSADVGGTVKGDIVVDGRAALGPHAHVQGNITSNSLVIAEGAVFMGRSEMGEGAAGQATAKDSILRRSRSS